MLQDAATVDYLVIGAGSAGCVLADRLSADGSRVLLLEAGPPDHVPWIHIPAGVLKLLRHPRVNWNYRTDPEPGTGRREIDWPRGKTLGGSSAINGMLWVRGNRADFERWAQMGAHGWSYDDVLPHFRTIESYAPGEPVWRGKAGPMTISDYNTVNPLTRCFVEAAQQVGFEFNPDLSGANPAEGVGYSQMSRAGRRRVSTARGFLARARGRANFGVETRAMATRLVFEGRRCVGATVRQGGRDGIIRAEREVILSGGTVNSPHLLQISGIGPAAHLDSIGVEVVHDLPGVGRDLSDHYVARVSMRVKGVETINELSRGWRLMREAAKYAAFGTGALTFGVSSAQGYLRSRPELAGPDLQFSFSPASYTAARFGTLENKPGVSCAVSIADPESRGEVMARSVDPFEYPALRPNYLSSRADLAALIHGIRKTREIFAAPAFERYRVAETVPGADIGTDDELEAFVRETGTTLYHIVGTCRMGVDPMAVVDPRLRVHGIGGLRVVDASVMPTVTTGNTNATTIMVGEKGAAMIREDAAA